MQVFIDPSVGDSTRFREHDFVTKVLAAASESADFPAHLGTAVVLSGHRRHKRWPILEQVDRPLIVVLGDEDARLQPDLIARSAALLQCYRPSDASWPDAVLRMPLGPGGPPPIQPGLPWQDRDLDVVFVGHLHRRRWSFARELGAVSGALRAVPDTLLPAVRRSVVSQPLRPLPHHQCLLRFTDRFGAGLSQAEHLHALSRARIALVPPGFKQDETFRHHEAARAGCVLVGTPIDGLPVVPFPLTGGLLTLLKDLLADPKALEARHQAVMSAWTETGCAEAVGRSLAARLSALTKHRSTAIG